MLAGADVATKTKQTAVINRLRTKYHGGGYTDYILKWTVRGRILIVEASIYSHFVHKPHGLFNYAT